MTISSAAEATVIELYTEACNQQCNIESIFLLTQANSLHQKVLVSNGLIKW